MKRLEKDIERLVHNKILGLISPEEEAMLEAWLNMSDKHRDSLKEMEDTALLAQRYKHYASIDNEKAWEEFTKKTGIEHTPLHKHSKFRANHCGRLHFMVSAVHQGDSSGNFSRSKTRHAAEP